MTTDQNKQHNEEQKADDSLGGFTLVDDDDTMSVSQLASLIERKTGQRVTTQTIRNHAEKGTITGVKHPKKGWRFPPAAIEEWRRNRPQPKHGGSRKNAGHKRKDALPSSTLTGQATLTRDAKNQIREQLTPDEDGNLPDPPHKAMRLVDVLRCTQEQLEAIISVRTPTELLDSVQISRLDELNKLQHSSLKLAKEKGELVEVREIRAAWLEEQQRIVELVLNVPKSVSNRIAAACWVSDEHRHRICSMLKDAGIDNDMITAVSHELARPPELNGRVRALIDDAIRKAMAEIADPPTAEQLGQ